jgi:hypothetical protein
MLYGQYLENTDRSGPNYPLGTIGTVPTTFLGPTKEWKGEKIKIKKI